MPNYKILILGASYGSLLASKILYGGHSVRLVCLPSEADLINTEGFRIRMPVKSLATHIEIDSRSLPGQVSASGPGVVDPSNYDLVGLAMQEPQYGSDGVRDLMYAIARSGVPCMSIMNMPPLPYIARIPGIEIEALRPAYSDSAVWDSFEPAALTLCSPDPQAIRPPGEPANVLEVTLPTNFKVARFQHERGNAILRHLEADIDAARFTSPAGAVELPVKLRYHDSIFVPLAKWAMLMAGNYRCITDDGIRTAREAVHSNLEESRSIYNFVCNVCTHIGASRDELVPFEKYAAAADSLIRPASAARALSSGALKIERADKLVQLAARQKGLAHPVLDDIVARVDRWLDKNRRAKAA